MRTLHILTLPLLLIFTSGSLKAQAFSGPTDKMNDPVKSIASDTVLPPRYNDVYFQRVVDTPPEIIGGTEVIDIMIEYPEAALQAGMEATVLVDVYIDSLGNVAMAKLREGVQGFNHAAINAVHKLHFVPAMSGGHTVNTITTLPIEFKIPEDKEIPKQIRRIEPADR